MYWGTAWPMLFVLNIEPSTPVTYAAAILSVAQALIVVWICTLAVGRRPAFTTGASATAAEAHL